MATRPRFHVASEESSHDWLAKRETSSQEEAFLADVICIHCAFSQNIEGKSMIEYAFEVFDDLFRDQFALCTIAFPELINKLESTRSIPKQNYHVMFSAGGLQVSIIFFHGNCDPRRNCASPSILDKKNSALVPVFSLINWLISSSLVPKDLHGSHGAIRLD